MNYVMRLPSLSNMPTMTSQSSPVLLEPLFPITTEAYTLEQYDNPVDQFKHLLFHDEQLRMQVEKLTNTFSSERSISMEAICPRDVSPPGDYATIQSQPPVHSTDLTDFKSVDWLEGFDQVKEVETRRVNRASTSSSTSSTGQKKPTNMTEKEWRRKIKNRESAKRSRVRKVAYFEQLEVHHQSLLQQHAQLLARLQHYEKNCKCMH
jgi:hypothetical protein